MNDEREAHVTGYGTYFIIWLALIVLLFLSIWASRIQFVRYGALINLGIATIKAGLVLAFFMHLKDAGKFLIAVFLLTLTALFAIIGLTYSDTWFRY